MRWICSAGGLKSRGRQVIRQFEWRDRGGGFDGKTSLTLFESASILVLILIYQRSWSGQRKSIAKILAISVQTAKCKIPIGAVTREQLILRWSELETLWLLEAFWNIFPYTIKSRRLDRGDRVYSYVFVTRESTCSASQHWVSTESAACWIGDLHLHLHLHLHMKVSICIYSRDQE